MQTSISKKTEAGEPLKYFMDSSKLETENCINWKYSTTKIGYGLLNYKNKLQYVHRLALVQKIGEAPENKQYALHSCRNRACFNYRHLRWGTQTENCADKIKDGTNITPRGAAHGRSKLTEEQIISIRKDTRPRREIAKEYGVTVQNISVIKLGKSWDCLKR